MMTEYNNYRQNMLKLFKSNDYILAFLKKNKLAEAILTEQFSLFKDCYESFAKCQNCQGLYACTQLRSGEKLGLDYQGFVMNRIEYCPYKVAELKKNAQTDAYAYSDIPEELYGLNMNNIEVNSLSLKGLYKLCYDLLSGKSNRGLYIYGDMGVGKTYMCTALANSLVKTGRKVAFVKCSQYVNMMRKCVVNDPMLYEKDLKLVKEADVLILDDIGSESVSAFSRDDLLFNILDYRMENHLITLFTSNMSKSDLMLHYTFDKNDRSMFLRAKRLLERIDILAADYVLKGDNLRRSAYGK